MPDNIASTAILLLFLLVGALAAIRILVKSVRNRFTPVKKVKAVVIGKHTQEAFSKYAGNGKHKKYIIVFSAEGKKLSFYVSGFSFAGYRINEKGILKYKGERIISFDN